MVWAGLSVTSPSRIANYDFRFIAPEDSLTLSFSRSSPPLAILEDERLTVVRTELGAPHVKGATLISSGTIKAWPRLRRYAKFFQADARWLQRHLQKNHSRPYQVRHQVVRKSRPYFARLSPIEELTRLVQPIIEGGTTASGMRRADFISSFSGHVRRLAAAQISKEDVDTPRPATTARPMNVREDVERPLTVPVVPRGLPSGEDAPPIVIQEDHVGWQPSQSPQDIHLFKPLAEDSQADENPAVGPVGLPSAPVVNRSPASTWQVASARISPATTTNPSRTVAGAPPSSAANAIVQAAVPGSANIYAFDGGSGGSEQVKSFGQSRAPLSTASNQTSASNQADSYTLVGQVELTGGLAATGYSTKLGIQWKTGNETRDGNVDYSTGRFIIQVPTLEAGKIVASLVDDTGRILGRGDYDLDGIAAPGQRTIEGIDMQVIAQETAITGQVFSAYDVGDAFVPVTGAEVFGPAQAREAADDKGHYSLSGLNTDATLLLDSYATDYWGTRVIVAGNIAQKVPLFSDKMMDSFLDLVGQSSNSSDYGIVWGVVKHGGKPVAGAQMALSSTGVVGPIYFNELRIPDQNLKATSSNGLFAFVKVKPGLDVVMAQYGGRELPSTVVSISPSTVSYSEISFKTLQLMGRVFDPVANQNVSAQISVVGASQTARSNSQGFKLRIPSSDPVIFVDANPGNGYMVSREAVPRKSAHEINLMVYQKDWISSQLDKVGMKYDETNGLLLGYVDGPQFNVRLDDGTDLQDSADANDQNVLYFDETGVLDPSLTTGAAGGGAFMMTNLKPGLHTLVVTGESGEMVSSRIFVSEGGVLNVLSMPLRP